MTGHQQRLVFAVAFWLFFSFFVRGLLSPPWGDDEMKSHHPDANDDDDELHCLVA